MNGLQNSFISVLNQIILKLYPTATDSLWIVGLALCCAGICSCALVGLLLDLTHRYKQIPLLCIVCSGVVIAIWTGVIEFSLTVMFIMTFIVGFFVVSFLPAGLELGAEISYPTSEVITTSLLTFGGSIIGIALTFIGTSFMEDYGVLYCNLTFLVVVVAAFIVTAFVKPDFRRLEANLQETSAETTAQ